MAVQKRGHTNFGVIGFSRFMHDFKNEKKQLTNVLLVDGFLISLLFVILRHGLVRHVRDERNDHQELRKHTDLIHIRLDVNMW